MIESTGALALDYAFLPNPTPILAPTPGGRTTAIQVIVSNPSTQGVIVSSIQITIPTGDPLAPRDLSAAPAYGDISYDTSIPWKITASGPTITIAPTSGKPQAVTNAVVFTIGSIRVNGQPGTVPITIAEFSPAPGHKVDDDTTYSLLKQPGDYPVTAFWAEPATVTHLDQGVTLHWTCSAQAQPGLLFGVAMHTGSARGGQQAPSTGRSAGAPPVYTPDECVTNGTCYSPSDGTTGITVPSINQETTFELAVIRTVSVGHREIVATTPVTVPVVTPEILQGSSVTASRTGRLVTLRWVALNTRACTVSLDGATIDDAAPADTYTEGYWVVLDGQPAVQQLALTAHAEIGNAVAQMTFPDVRVTPLASIPMTGGAVGVAFTPDARLVLASGGDGNIVTVIDTSTLQPESPPIAVGGPPAKVVMAPDGAHAFVLTGALKAGTSIDVIDIAQRKAEQTAIRLAAGLGLAITPDGTTLLVVEPVTSSLVLIDVASRTVARRISLGAGVEAVDLAVTPDGAFAVIPAATDLEAPGVVLVVDLRSRAVVSRVPSFDPIPHAVAISPDGALALVLNGTSISVFDIASRTMDPHPIALAGPALGMAITADGRCALVATETGNCIYAVDVPARTVRQIPTGAWTFSVTIAPDGSMVLLPRDDVDQLLVL
jgi:hypothetical protein